MAAYNPRYIPKDNARRLRENLRMVGLVGPALVVNKRTGNLVSGHKRLAALDILEEYDGSAGKDYALDITVIDWTVRRERQQNVFYNNYRAQGEFDQELLAEVLLEDLPGLEAFGFDEVEIGQMFPGDERFGWLFPDVEPGQSTMPGAKGALDAVEEMKDARNDTAARERAAAQSASREGAPEDDHRPNAKSDASTAFEQTTLDSEREYKENVAERRYAYTDQLITKTAADFYVVIVCRDDAHCREVLDAIGVTDVTNRYVSGDRVLAAIGTVGR